MNQDELIGTMWIGPDEDYNHSLVLILYVVDEDYYTNKLYAVLRCDKFEKGIFYSRRDELKKEGWTRLL